jgi:hypothetical protein
MKQHKWHKEIKAWADGAEIQFKDANDNNQWLDCTDNEPTWEILDFLEFRIKPQPSQVLKEMIDGCNNIMQDKEMPKEARELAKVFQEDCYRLKDELGYV